MKKLQYIFSTIKKNKIKNIIYYLFKSLLFKKGFILEKMASADKIKEFISLFRNNYLPVNMIRVGGASDGGYLVPNKLSSIKYCFSLGCDNLLNFELDLSKNFQIKSFIADGSMSSLPSKNKDIEFTSKYIGVENGKNFISLSRFVNNKVGKNETNMILQMDIEGYEYEVLSQETEEFFSRFDIIIMEFHQTQNIFLNESLKMLNANFNKIFKNFSVCHIHPHNGLGIKKINDIKIPRGLEITFAQKNFIQGLESDKILIPHPLDVRTIKDKKDMILPDIFWKK